MSEPQVASPLMDSHYSQNINMSHPPQETDAERRARIRAETWKGSNKYLVMEAQRGKPWQNALKSNEPQPDHPQGPMNNSYGAPAVHAPTPVSTVSLVGLGQHHEAPVPSVSPISPMSPMSSGYDARPQGTVPGNGLPLLAPRAPRAFYAQNAPGLPRNHQQQPLSPQSPHENWKLTGKERIALEADFEAEYEEMINRVYVNKSKRR